MANRKTATRRRPSKLPPEFRRHSVALVLNMDRPIAGVVGRSA